MIAGLAAAALLSGCARGSDDPRDWSCAPEWERYADTSLNELKDAVAEANSWGDAVIRMRDAGVPRDDPRWAEADSRVRKTLRQALAMCVCSPSISESAECDDLVELYEMFRE